MGHAAAKLSQALEDLYEEAVQLPQSERRILAERLLERLDGPPDRDVERARAKEPARRLAEIQAGRSEPAP